MAEPATHSLPSTPPQPDESSQYAITGIIPPPKAHNRARFKSFIDRINRRQWGFLGDAVHPSVRYNGDALSLYELTQLLRQEFGPKTTTTMEISTTAGGDPDTDPDGPVAARLHVKTLLLDGPHLPSTARQPVHVQYARLMLVYFADRKISQIHDISAADDDDDGPRQAQQTNSRHLAEPLSLRPPPPPPPSPGTPADLRQFYADYIASVK